MNWVRRLWPMVSAVMPVPSDVEDQARCGHVGVRIAVSAGGRAVKTTSFPVARPAIPPATSRPEIPALTSNILWLNDLRLSGPRPGGRQELLARRDDRRTLRLGFGARRLRHHRGRVQGLHRANDLHRASTTKLKTVDVVETFPH